MIKLVEINKLKPSTYNPRKADKQRLQLIELSLRKLGFLLPIYADENGEIISGHQRHYVAKRMGLKLLPVQYLPVMDLEKRKALNILFNRATNDFHRDDTSKTVTEKLSQKNVEDLAINLEDKKNFPCLNPVEVQIKSLTDANQGRWNRYARNVAASLYKYKIIMPVVCTSDLKVVNGIGRVQLLAEKKVQTVPVIILSDGEAAFAESMLNYLTMDFDIHNKYEDLLRYNSFRRAYTNRPGLGVGFYVAGFGYQTTKSFNFSQPATVKKWKIYYGTKVLDFGAGHLTDTKILRSIGVDVTPFEPYRIKAGTNEIDIEESKKLSLEFLHRVRNKFEWNSIFISSVLNSVPFLQDRIHLVHLLAACCTEKTRVFIWAMNVNHKCHQSIERDFLNASESKQIRFRLDYEPGIILGGFSDKPKVQKYHTTDEIKELFGYGFENIGVKPAGDSIAGLAATPVINRDALRKAIEFEFDLPYPDGSRMGLVDKAIDAFEKRLGYTL